MSQLTKPKWTKRQLNGVLLLDKPSGISSNFALQRARRLFQAAKGGHTGVLDPLATGLLPLCFGEATKFCSYLLEADKAYRATLQFGSNTTTGDSEGEIISQQDINFNLAMLNSTIEHFIGNQMQIPPMYSALKFQGKPLYEYARQGINIDRPARNISIYAINLINYCPETAVAIIDVSCSKGTYIRTLTEDIGKKLNCGAHLIALRRTATAGFNIQQAITLEQIEAAEELGQRDAYLLPAEVLVSHLPSIQLNENESIFFKQGQSVCIDASYGIMARLRVYKDTQGFIGLGEVIETGRLNPLRLMAT